MIRFWWVFNLFILFFYVLILYILFFDIFFFFDFLFLLLWLFSNVLLFCCCFFFRKVKFWFSFILYVFSLRFRNLYSVIIKMMSVIKISFIMFIIRARFGVCVIFCFLLEFVGRWGLYLVEGLEFFMLSCFDFEEFRFGFIKLVFFIWLL